MIEKLDKSNDMHETARKPLKFDDLKDAGNPYNKVTNAIENQPVRENDGRHI